MGYGWLTTLRSSDACQLWSRTTYENTALNVHYTIPTLRLVKKKVRNVKLS